MNLFRMFAGMRVIWAVREITFYTSIPHNEFNAFISCYADSRAHHVLYIVVAPWTAYCRQ